MKVPADCYPSLLCAALCARAIDISKEDCTPLLLSEVEFILNGRVDAERTKLSGREPNMDPLLMKTLAYVKRFGFYPRDSFNPVRE